MLKFTAQITTASLAAFVLLAPACSKSKSSDPQPTPQSALDSSGNPTNPVSGVTPETTTTTPATTPASTTAAPATVGSQGTVASTDPTLLPPMPGSMSIRFPSKVVAAAGEYIEFSDRNLPEHRPLLAAALYRGSQLIVPVGTRINGTMQFQQGVASTFAASWLLLDDGQTWTIDGVSAVSTTDEVVSSANWKAIGGGALIGGAAGAIIDRFAGHSDVNWWSVAIGAAAGGTIGGVFFPNSNNVVVLAKDTSAIVQFRTR